MINSEATYAHGRTKPLLLLSSIVLDEIKIDKEARGLFFEVTNTRQMKGFFRDRFSIATIEHLFKWIKGVVDWDKCSRDVHRFLRCVYINLCV
ncbi:MAG: hypothetical protein FRX48_08062 [Lasallia pustulata]|uniref:Uncharacterized protein n=1 Tax=Lasallia pustulata TaxID=136370 RepID=A0A5M8PHC6_9LECA|nr:MAG: hypothetical protein FRX48_08062 [Lasallia pustulata]